MASRFNETVDKSKWSHKCYIYKHIKCKGIRFDNGEKPCECGCHKL